MADQTSQDAPGNTAPNPGVPALDEVLDVQARKADGTPYKQNRPGAPYNGKAEGTLTGGLPRKPGRPPLGNTNALTSGTRASPAIDAQRGKYPLAARRKQRKTYRALIKEIGGSRDLPLTVLFIAERFSKRLARLSMMEKAVDNLIAEHPKLRNNPDSLSKLNAYISPLESALIADAQVLGSYSKMLRPSVSVSERMAALEAPKPDDAAIVDENDDD